VGVGRMALIQFRSTMREKSAVFWIIAWPILWLVLTAFVFAPPHQSFSVPIAIVETPGSSKLVHEVAGYGNSSSVAIVKVRSCCYPCTSLAEELVRIKGFDVVIVPQCYADNASSRGLSVYTRIFVKASNPSTEYAYVGAAMQLLQRYMVSESISRLTALAPKLEPCLGRDAMPKLIGAAYPLIPQIEEVKPSKSWSRAQVLGLYAVGAIGYSALISAMTSGAGIFAFRREGGMLRRILASPARLTTIALADLASSAMITAVAGAATAVTAVALGAKLWLDPASLDTWLGISCIALGVVDGYLVGLLLALAARDPRGASGIAVVVSLMLVFTTGIWFPPKEWLPTPLRAFASWCPLSTAFDIAKQLIVWRVPIATLAPEITRLAATSLALLAITSLAYWRRTERIAHRLLT